MNTFFIIAGITITILGVLAIAVISGIYIAVKFFGGVLTFGSIKETDEDNFEEE